jgi:hypothetical protein
MAAADPLQENVSRTQVGDEQVTDVEVCSSVCVR